MLTSQRKNLPVIELLSPSASWLSGCSQSKKTNNPTTTTITTTSTTTSRWIHNVRGVPCLWVKCLDRPSVPILGRSIELVGILFSLQMIQPKCHAANAWQCDSPSPSTVSYAAMCLGLPSSCLLAKEKPDCLTLVHTVRPSDAHRAYLHESDICRTLTISGHKKIIVHLYFWFILVGKWKPLSRLAMGIKVLWVTRPVQNSQPRSWSKNNFPSVWLETRRKPSCAKCTFSFSKHYFWQNPLAPTPFQILVWQRQEYAEHPLMQSHGH